MTPPDDTLKRLEEIEGRGLICLVPKHGGLTSHEKTVCDCTVLWLCSTLREQLAVNQMLKEVLTEMQDFTNEHISTCDAVWSPYGTSKVNHAKCDCYISEAKQALSDLAKIEGGE